MAFASAGPSAQFISCLLDIKENRMSLESLEDLFLQEIKDIYDAEKQILKALPKMAKAVESEELRAAIEEHHAVTEKQVERLEEVFQMLDKPARGKKCVAMEGLLKEGSELLKEDAEPAVLEAAIIAAAQKVEHYEIAVYGTLATYAEILGYEDAKELLGQTLEEEKETDETLTQIASHINFEAADEGEEEEEEMAAGKKRSR
jgi:ferritin-like metal-binding protein YciE